MYFLDYNTELTTIFYRWMNDTIWFQFKISAYTYEYCVWPMHRTTPRHMHLIPTDTMWKQQQHVVTDNIEGVWYCENKARLRPLPCFCLLCRTHTQIHAALVVTLWQFIYCTICTVWNGCTYSTSSLSIPKALNPTAVILRATNTSFIKKVLVCRKEAQPG